MDILTKLSIPSGVERLHGVDVAWPSANAAGLMRNDGSGNISWDTLYAATYSGWSMFAARNNTGQSISPGTFTQVLLQAEDQDHLSEFTSSAFTAQATGTYIFHGAAIFSSAIGGTRALLTLYKNGSEWLPRLVDTTVGATNDFGISGGLVIDLSIGDVIGLAIWQNNPSSISQTIFGTFAGMQGVRIH